MVEWWRLTRNRYGRAIYDALAAVGVTATVMYEYRRALPVDTDLSDAQGTEVSVERSDPETVRPLDAPVDELLDDEDLLVATDGDEPLGYLFLSVDATQEIHPLERRFAIDGAYVRRVYVHPNHRGEGVASELLVGACTRARERGASTATALVALDNRPSRALFRGRGFEPERKHRYVRIGPVSHRSEAPI